MKRTPSAVLFASLLVLGSAGCDRGPTQADQAKVAPMAAPTATPAPGTTPAPGAPGAAAATDGTKYGAGLADGSVVAIDEVIANPQAFAGKKVRVEGMVTDVCPKRGCWFEMAGTGAGKKLRFKVQDGVMTFPMEAKGKHAVAEGVVAVTELSLEESKQHAEYQAKEYGIAYDPASITTPTLLVRIDGTGAMIRDRK
ncbi:MAG: DUF4920 domain-containing protein [Kofleriaceae bacterium]|jgi:hypothetical protein|nr:DUF4920 domain-containing protein [Kofleriaceae bacterium]